MRLGRLLYREHMKALELENFNRELARAMFTEVRDRYIANLCGYIRTYNNAERAGVTLPEPYRSREWCNAAVQILVVADEPTQDLFIRSEPQMKDRMVNAVLEDAGVLNLAEFFVELPPC